MAMLVEVFSLLAPLAAYGQALPASSGYALVSPSVTNVGQAYSSFTAANQVGYAVSSATTVGTSTGVTITENGIATFAKAGGASTLKVPVSIASNVSKTAIASAAGKAFGAIRTLSGPIGVAVTAWTLYDAYSKSGLSVCPPPDFFCKYVDDSTIAWKSAYSPCRTVDPAICSLQQVANLQVAAYIAGGWKTAVFVRADATTGTGTTVGSGRATVMHFTIGDGTGWTTDTTVNASGVIATAGGHLDPAQQADLVAAAQAQMDADTTGAQSKIYFDAVTSTWQKFNPAGGFVAGTITAEDMVPTGSATTVKSPPFTAPAEVISTTTFKDANGADQTKTTQQQVVVTPAIVPGTSGASTQVAYTIGSTVTDSTTNGSGAPTVTTQTQQQTTTPNTALPKDFPNDYNREVTQQAIQKELAGTGAPDMPDQKAIITGATDKASTDLTQMRTDAQTAQTSASPFFGWVWTPPVGECAASSGTVHGYSVSWDICPTVNNIRGVLGWMMGVFALVSVYGELFRRSDD